MFPSSLHLRLQQLETNISRVLQLLHEYEEELLDEDDPGKKSRYRRRIENLKKLKVEYEKEFTELQTQLGEQYPLQAKTIASQLQEIDNKIELLIDSQSTLSKVLMLHFSSREQAFLLPLIQQLDECESIDIQAFLEAVESNQISTEEAQLTLNETRYLLKEIQERGLVLPEANESISELINTPMVDAKHALKISIPLIPFILAYEGELGLGTEINLKEIWKRWKSNFSKN
jgi:hypothetical protein